MFVHTLGILDLFQSENKDLKSLVHHYSEWNNKLNSEMNETRLYFQNMISNKGTGFDNCNDYELVLPNHIVKF